MNMKKKTKKSISILYTWVIFFLIIIIINNNNIFKKTFKIIKKENYSKRIENVYGYCNGPSVGYLKFIKEKFKLKFNPKIINFDQTSPSDWSIYDLRLEKNNNKIILLNYKKTLSFIFNKQKKNEWTFNDQIQKIESINKIEFTTIYNDETYINGTLNLYEINSRKQKKLVYKKKINQIINSKPINIDFKTENFNSYHGTFLIEFDNLQNNNLKNINNIILSSNNYFKIENYKIINQEKNCYYVSSRN
jgi:hypothetical protein